MNEATFYFDDQGPGLYFLKGKNKTNAALGSNGSGKSSIIDALLWCLYGKTVQGLKNPDIIPWSGKGTTEVKVTITIDKKQHVICRTANPNLLTIDEEEVGQEYVSKLIAIPYEIIPFTIILGQKQPLFFDLLKSEKLKLFSEVLNLDRWEQRSAHASDLALSLDREITSKQSELDSCLNAQTQTLADFNSLKQQSSSWEAERAERLSNAESEIKTLRKQIAAVMNERDTADLQLERAETELKALIKSINVRYSELRSANNNINYCETNLKHERKEKQKVEDQIKALSNDNCPTCKQPFKSENLRKQIETTLKNALKSFINGIEVNQDSFDRNVVAANHIQLVIERLEKSKQKFESDANEARNILDRLQPKIANWQAEIKAIEKQLQLDEANDNPYTEQLQTLRRRRDQYKATIEQTNKAIKEKTEQQERTKFWVKGFKDIKLLTVEEILQELELTTNAMIEESGLVGWQVKYGIERETKQGTIARGLNIVILSPGNKNAVKWEVWSGGEAQRLRLIGTAALSSVLLNHVGVTTNCEIFDEPTVGLSKEGISDLVELLAQRAKDTKKSILLVDHHVISSSKFVSEITVVKDKTGSFIEV